MSTIILNHSEIKSKIKRLAWQIHENNMDEKVIWIVGIDERGAFLAELITDELRQISDIDIRSVNIVIDRKNYEAGFYSEHDMTELRDANVVLVDDVLNTCKTIVSAMLPLVQRQVNRIQLAVLASRSHKHFPVVADFVGISMATTIQEHLSFDMSDPERLQLSLS